MRLLLSGLCIAGLQSGCATVPVESKSPLQEPIIRVSNQCSNGEALSFWKDRVQYVLPVQYFRSDDSLGQVWEVAIADSHAGTPWNKHQQTLVLIHGRGAHTGYFSQLIRQAYEAGLRVVAVDLPGYGKSLPGNLNNRVARSLNDSRAVVHDILVNQIGISRATYLGHSMGGQWVLGYALDFPDSVSKLILESSHGLEEYPEEVTYSDGFKHQLFRPQYLNDFGEWHRNWSSLDLVEQQKARSAADIFTDHYSKHYMEHPGKTQYANRAYFSKESVDSVFYTRVRQLQPSHEIEFDRFLQVSTWDIYSQGVELLQNDPNSLYKQIHRIKVPVFMAFGALDPLLPSRFSVTNGADQRAVVRSAYERLSRSGNAPVVVTYPDAGHVPHADVSSRFAEDALLFIEKNQVASPIDKFKLNANAQKRRTTQDKPLSAGLMEYRRTVASKLIATADSQYAEELTLLKPSKPLGVKLKIGPKGLLHRVEIVESSGNKSVDQMVLKIAIESAPFPKPNDSVLRLSEEVEWNGKLLVRGGKLEIQ